VYIVAEPTLAVATTPPGPATSLTSTSTSATPLPASAGKVQSNRTCAPVHAPASTGGAGVAGGAASTVTPSENCDHGPAFPAASTARARAKRCWPSAPAKSRASAAMSKVPSEPVPSAAVATSTRYEATPLPLAPSPEAIHAK